MYSLRDVFVFALIRLAERDERIYVLDCDVAPHNRLQYFIKQFPQRGLQLGIAEQNAIGVAAGMATCGLLPVVSSFAAFIVGRCWEQIRHSVAYNRANVKIFATHAGLSAGEDGATHQCLDDLALMLAIPGMHVFAPAFDWECETVVKQVLESSDPAYIRVGRDEIDDVSLPHGGVRGAMQVTSGEGKTAVISTGEITHEAIEASLLLKEYGMSARVIHVSRLHPFPVDDLKDCLRGVDTIFTVEEHRLHGGLHSIISRFLVNSNIKVHTLGQLDGFGQTGRTDELRRYYGIDKHAIINKIIHQSE